MQVTDEQVKQALDTYNRHPSGVVESMRAALESVQISPVTDEELRQVYAMTPGTGALKSFIQNFINLRNSPESGEAYGKIMSALQGATLTRDEAGQIAVKLAVASASPPNPIVDSASGFKPKHYGIACEKVMSILRGATLTPKEGFEIADFAIKASHPRLQDDPRRKVLREAIRDAVGLTMPDERLGRILDALDEVK